MRLDLTLMLGSHMKERDLHHLIRVMDDGHATPIVAEGETPAGSSAAHAAMAGSAPSQTASRNKDGKTPTDLEIELATGEYLGQLGISLGSAGEGLKADIQALIRKRVRGEGAATTAKVAEATTSSAQPDVQMSEPPSNAGDNPTAAPKASGAE